MKRITLALLSISFLASCSPSYHVAYDVDTCVEEVDNRYAGKNRSPSSIYKIDDVVINQKSKEPEIKVSSWSHSQWFYQGKKPHYFFKDTKLFSYQEVDCPKRFGEEYRKKNLGIDKRIKKIDL
ncbi:hypothetical protein [Halobacteriovorax sp. ZH4_bin.1]|uniref:hypothetical protein n=1 Tax=unclassified Halobacteriovorax TaxID=2639665 RepID=UPI0037231ACA